jgi:hypothetical protein
MASLSNTLAAVTLASNNGLLNLINSTESILIPAVPANHAYKVNSLYISNTSSGTVTLDVNLYRSTIKYPLSYQLSIPISTTLVIIDKNSLINMMETDSIRVQMTSGTSATCIASYEDFS